MPPGHQRRERDAKSSSNIPTLIITKNKKKKEYFLLIFFRANNKLIGGFIQKIDAFSAEKDICIGKSHNCQLGE